MNRFLRNRGPIPSLARSPRLCAAAIAALLAGQAGAFEVKVYAIGDFVPTASGGCGGNDIGSWPNMVDEWYDEMGDRGHTKDGQYTDGTMTIQRFCDPDWNGSCLDDAHVDDADAAMIALHGSDGGDHWQGTMRSSWSGECKLDAGGTADNMNVGDIDLEFIHLSSCQSADDDNLSGIRNAMTDPVDGGYAHQWDGFHGLMWIGGGLFDDYENFAADAHSVSIAYSWVTNHYHDDEMDCDEGPCDDQCPIAYSIQASESGALTRLNNERYNYIYTDPTGNSWYAYMYYAGCDPLGETTFAP
jgi:hypothetical protein